MIAGLWNAKVEDKPVGTATTGSSEAIMLGGLALKRLWQERQKKAGKSIHEPGPNVVMGAEVQVSRERESGTWPYSVYDVLFTRVFASLVLLLTCRLQTRSLRGTLRSNAVLSLLPRR
jgi:hypothetical protein